MTSFKLLPFLFLQMLFTAASMIKAAPANPKLFREYIGAENKGVTFTEVPVDSNVEFHFILSFAIDYTTQSHNPSPTNGDFNVFWDTEKLTPAHVSAIKALHPNAKVALSLGGDTVGNKNASFNPKSINSWVRNAVYSLTQIIRKYHLDGIDIDYEHFQTDPNTFAECIGRLLFSLKQNNIVSFTSIAPYDDDSVQQNYLALWGKYGHLIDYVNFQFYAYDKGTTTTQFLKYFEKQSSNYKGGKILVSFGTDNSGGLSPEHGFFAACTRLKRQGKLHGIFIWSADDSRKDHFRYEKQSQAFLSSVI